MKRIGTYPAAANTELYCVKMNCLVSLVGERLLRCGFYSQEIYFLVEETKHA